MTASQTAYAHLFGLAFCLVLLCGGMAGRLYATGDWRCLLVECRINVEAP